MANDTPAVEFTRPPARGGDEGWHRTMTQYRISQSYPVSETELQNLDRASNETSLWSSFGSAMASAALSIWLTGMTLPNDANLPPKVSALFAYAPFVCVPVAMAFFWMALTKWRHKTGLVEQIKNECVRSEQRAEWASRKITVESPDER